MGGINSVAPDIGRCALRERRTTPAIAQLLRYIGATVVYEVLAFLRRWFPARPFFRLLQWEKMHT